MISVWEQDEKQKLKIKKKNEIVSNYNKLEKKV